MRTYLRIVFLFSAVLSSSAPVAGQTSNDDLYREWVDYRDGEISIAFERIPIQFALYALHAKTGFQIVIPSGNLTKFVNFKLDRQPFEPAMRSLISTIGYKNFAVMYDDHGRPHRALVLGAPTPAEAAASTAAKSEAAPQALTAEERDKLQKDLARWSDLKREERGRLEDRLKNLPPSDEREQLVKEYGQQVLGLAK
jgi:hypothetical protein